MKTQLMMQEESDRENTALGRVITRLRHFNFKLRLRHSVRRRRRLDAEQSYGESSNNKASVWYSSSLDAKQRRQAQAAEGKICWCPPGFCRCQIKTPVHNSNRAVMPTFSCNCPPGFSCRCKVKTFLIHDLNQALMSMSPCTCPPGFSCRCQIIETQVYNSNRAVMPMFTCQCPPGFSCRCLLDEDDESCDESVGSWSPETCSDQNDQWMQGDDEVTYTDDRDRVVPMPVAIKGAAHCCNCPPGFCRCHSNHIGGSRIDDADPSDCMLIALKYHGLENRRKG